MSDKVKNLFYLFFPIIVGSIVGLITNNFIDYNSLNQPPLSPPAITFPIVWSILYLLIGLSYYFYRRNNDDEQTNFIYYLQLVINYFWSIFFFVFKWRFFSIIWLVLLVITIIILMLKYYKESKISFYLLIPYLIWCLFATYLNIGVYILN